MYIYTFFSNDRKCKNINIYWIIYMNTWITDIRYADKTMLIGNPMYSDKSQSFWFYFYNNEDVASDFEYFETCKFIFIWNMLLVGRD